jgi:hypothetical protein
MNFPGTTAIWQIVLKGAPTKAGTGNIVTIETQIVI